MIAASGGLGALIALLLALPLSAAEAPSAAQGATPFAADREAKGAGIRLERGVLTGGGRSSAGTLSLQGTLGQPDVDPLQPATGGVFSLTGGFWAGMVPVQPPGDAVFRDSFEPPLR